MDNSTTDVLILTGLFFVITLAVLYILMKASIRVVLNERDAQKFSSQVDEKKHLEILLKSEKISRQEYDARMLTLPALIVYGKY